MYPPHTHTPTPTAVWLCLAVCRHLSSLTSLARLFMLDCYPTVMLLPPSLTLLDLADSEVPDPALFLHHSA